MPYTPKISNRYDNMVEMYRMTYLNYSDNGLYSISKHTYVPIYIRNEYPGKEGRTRTIHRKRNVQLGV